MRAGSRLHAMTKQASGYSTLRNVDKRPYPTFVKACGHYGYFKSQESIVHFYNTRDALVRCRPNACSPLSMRAQCQRKRLGA